MNNQLEKQKAFAVTVENEITVPSYYAVVLHNDDYTTMDFVIEILHKFFALAEAEAEKIMLAVHHQGRGVCGVYTAEIAETKVALVTNYAKEYQFPLLCTMEKV